MNKASMTIGLAAVLLSACIPPPRNRDPGPAAPPPAREPGPPTSPDTGPGPQRDPSPNGYPERRF